MKLKRQLIIGLVMLVVLLGGVGGLVALRAGTETPDIPAENPGSSQEKVEETPAPSPTPTPAPTPTPMLPKMAELYEKNKDVVGWLRIPDTKLDYAVVHTPEDPHKYLNLDLDGDWSGFGTIFIEAACSLEPRSVNLLFHGHNMVDGSMFRTVMDYKDQSFYEAHPIIEFSDLYENKQYEIFAVLRDRLYYNYEDCFKYYEFLDPATEEEFKEGIAYFKENSLYDTGITPEFGDKLITLSTCAYHTKHGRMLVLAREITEPEASPAPAAAPQA